MDVVRLADPRLQFIEIRDELETAIDAVLRRGVFTPDVEVAAFESEFAEWMGKPHAVATASGSAALTLALRAVGVVAGDQVAVTANLDISAVAPITQLGAVPLWVDIDGRSHTMSPVDLQRRVTPNTRAVVVVHTQGFAAAMTDLTAVTEDLGIPLVEDATHGPGGFHAGRRLGGIGDVGCFSLAPTKPLGALGNAGIVVTSSELVAQSVQTHANYGFRRDSIEAIRAGDPAAMFHYEEAGVNATMDELQAAVLRVKLRHIDEWAERRRANLREYRLRLGSSVVFQESHDEASIPSPRTCVIRHPRRDEVAVALHRAGVSTSLQYVPPLHVQVPYGQSSESADAILPVTELVADELMCLPLAPELPPAAVRWAVEATREAVASVS